MFVITSKTTGATSWTALAIDDPFFLFVLKPIFHWKLGSRWLPNANEINTKNMKCTWPTPKFCVGTQRNLHSTGLRLGFASGKTQILGFASGCVGSKIPTCWYSPRKILASGALPNANPRHQILCVAVEYRL